MGNTLRLICMTEDGRTWQYRIRAAWVKICLCALLVLPALAGAGAYGSYFFWRKESLATMENEAMRSTVANMRSRLNRLELFERALRTHDQQIPPLYGNKHFSQRVTDAGMELDVLEADVAPVPWAPSSQADPAAASNLDPAKASASDSALDSDTDSDATLARQVSGQQPMGDGNEDDQESHGAVVGGDSTPKPTGHVSEALHQEKHQESDPETDTELKSGPSGAIPRHMASMITPASPNLADASNVRLTMKDDSLELRLDLHNRSDTAIAGRISVSFIADGNQIVMASGDQRALRFRIQNFREVRSPLRLPPCTSMAELHAMRLDIHSHAGKLLYVATYPTTELLQGLEREGQGGLRDEFQETAHLREPLAPDGHILLNRPIRHGDAGHETHAP